MMLRGFLTLLLALPVMAQFAITNNATIYVSPGGNNATAIRGRMDRPWFSISNAVWAMQTGDRLIMLAGNYTNTLFYTNVNTASIKVWGKTNIVIEGAGPTTRLFGFGAGTHFQNSNCNNVVYRNFAVIGNKPAASAGAWLVNGPAVVFDNVGASQRITYEGMVLKDHPNHGISVSQDIDSPAADHVHVRHCYFENIGSTNGVPSITKDGPSVQITGNFWHVTDNVFTNVLRPVEIYSNVKPLYDGVVARNKMYFVEYEGICPVFGFKMVGFHLIDNVIKANPDGAHGTAMSGIAMGGNGLERCVISRNIISDFDAGSGIVLLNTGGTLPAIRWNSIANNVISNCSTGISMHDNDAHNTNLCGNTISGNILVNIGNDAIRFNGVDNRIEGNYAENVGFVTGVGVGIYSLAAPFAGTNRHNTIFNNRIVHAVNGITLTGANVRTNTVVFNHTTRCTTHVTDSATGTQTNIFNMRF